MQTHRRITPILASGVLCLLFAAGCGSQSGPMTDPANSSGENDPAQPASNTLTMSGKPPAQNDTLVYYYQDDPDTFNPIIANDDVSDQMHRICYEYLAQRRFDEPTKWEPLLAESWEFDPENLEYTIHLRKGVKWHPMTLPNGKQLPATEFTARDVKFTFDCILNRNVEASHFRSYFENPDAKDESERYKVKVSLVPGDPYTVKIKWTKPYFLMEEWSIWSIHMIPKHVYSVDENGEPLSFDVTSKEFADGFNTHWANTKACGTGPMMLKEWKKDQSLSFERNPNYWGEPFYFSNVTFRNISNTNTALQQVLQNELDYAVIAEKDHYVQSKSHPNVVAGKVKLADWKYPSYRYMGYNMNREFFKDKRVRWAMSHAVPVDTLVEKVFHNLAVRTTGPFYVESPTYNKSLPLVEFDLDKSRKLLDEAGWTDTNGDGVRDKLIDGQRVDARFDLMIYSDVAAYQTIAEEIKENCRRIGVQVIISPAKWALMLQKLRKKEFDACILGWVMDWKQDPFQLWHGSQADLPDTSNSIGYKNPEVDKLIEQLRITIDESEQIRLFHEIHRLIYEDQPYTFLFADKRTGGLHSRLENVNFYALRPAIYVREWAAGAARLMSP